MRDYYLFLIFGVLLLAVLGWALAVFASKNTRGAWDTISQTKGQYRSRKWAYKERVESVRSYLFPDDDVWPFPGDSSGIHAVRSSDDSTHVQWRAAITDMNVIGRAGGQCVLFAFQPPIQADAKTLTVPALFAYAQADGGYALDATMDAASSPRQNQPYSKAFADEPSVEVIATELLGGEFGAITHEIPGAVAIGVSGETVCIAIDPEAGQAYVATEDNTYAPLLAPEYIQVIEDAANLMWRKIPARYWL
ncbi:MAG: hypothetical protein SPI14_07395 [Arcanobacterium sp.]|nr:hypothetical protein [Arcanobacterium sp.]